MTVPSQWKTQLPGRCGENTASTELSSGWGTPLTATSTAENYTASTDVWSTWVSAVKDGILFPTVCSLPLPEHPALMSGHNVQTKRPKRHNNAQQDVSKPRSSLPINCILWTIRTVGESNIRDFVKVMSLPQSVSTNEGLSTRCHATIYRLPGDQQLPVIV